MADGDTPDLPTEDAPVAAPRAEDADEGADVAEVTAEAPTAAEPTILDVLKDAHETVGAMVEAIEGETTDKVDMDDLLMSARSLLSAVDAGPACPMCQGAGTLDEEPAEDPRAERCPDCHGRGKVFTGSLVPESAVRACGKCAGAGFVNLADVHQLTPPPVDYTQPPTDKQWYDSNDPTTWHLPLAPGVPAPATV